MLSPESQTLTRQYRAQDAALSARLRAAVAQAWPALSPNDVDRTWPVVAPVLARLVASGHAASTTLAVRYLREHARLNGVVVSPLTAPPLPVAQVETALVVTGPVALKKAASLGATADQAARRALVQVLGSTSRLQRLGGIDTVLRTVDGAPRVAGYQRVTSGKPCGFCAMLASRGPVYRSSESASRVGGRGVDASVTRGRSGGQGRGVRARGNQALGERFHDHCFCTVEPVYDTDQPLSSEAQRYLDLYNEVKVSGGRYGAIDAAKTASAMRAALAA